jgi:hypothetical protein
MNHALLAVLEKFGNRYVIEFLGDYNKEKLDSDWLAGYEFFLSRAMYQGRRDEVSTRVLESALPIIRDIFKDCNNFPIGSIETLRMKLRLDLEGVIGKGKIGKYRDIEMIVSAIKFIERLKDYDYNMVSYSISKIKDGATSSLYHQLQPSMSDSGITQVGPKIASFFIRDLICLYSLEQYVDRDMQFCLQPIDTWVAQICEKSGLVRQGESHENIKRSIAKYCMERDIPPIRFNQGAWYMGKYSLDLLIEYIGKA